MSKATNSPNKVQSVAAKKLRLRKLSKAQQKAKDKKTAKQAKPVIGSFRLSRNCIKLIANNWKVLGGITAVYILLDSFLANGINNLNNKFTAVDGRSLSSSLSSAVDSFGSLIGGSSGSSATGSFTQFFLLILVSLALICAYRRISSDKPVTVKRAYYDSTAQLVPFILVLAVIFVQFLPLLLGSVVINSILQTVFTGSAASQVVIFLLFFVPLAAWTLYMISSSIFAMYIVTLPDMQPLQALRSAKKLVRFKRWQLLRRICFLPILVVVALALVTLPLILFASFLVAVIFYLLSMLSVIYIHGYLYGLYKDLINEQ